MPHRRKRTSPREIRPRIVRCGRDTFPFVGDADIDAVRFYHHASREKIPVPWLMLLEAGAATAGLTADQFLDHLKSLVISGPSARTSETSDARDAQSG